MTMWRCWHERDADGVAATDVVDVTDVVDLRDAPIDLAPGGPKVLLVDDEIDLHAWLGVALDLQGWAVICAVTGEEGLAIAERWQPDVVILDQRLPGSSGIDCARRLRAAGSGAQLVMFSAWLDPTAQAAAEAIGLETISKVDHSALLRYMDAVATTIPAH
jgi:CheY-like chemotaxis protein